MPEFLDDKASLRVYVIIAVVGCCGLTLLCIMCRDTYLSWGKRTIMNWKGDPFKGPRNRIMPLSFRAKRIHHTMKRRREEHLRASRVGVKIADGSKRPTDAELAEVERRENMEPQFVKVRRVVVEDLEVEVYGWEDLDSSLSRECRASVRRVSRRGDDKDENISLKARWEEVEQEEGHLLEVELAGIEVWHKEGGRYGGSFARHQ